MGDFSLALPFPLSPPNPTQCNNPLTKEPKLTAAKRIVPEWVGIDSEVQALRDRLLANKSGDVQGTKADKGKERDEL